MTRQEHDIPNWILKDSDHFTLKSTRKFFLDPGVPCGWGKIIWSQYIPLSKTMELWKVFRGRLPTDQHILHKGLHICSICTFCEKQEESIQHLLLECPNALHIWSWVWQIFLNSHFSNVDDLLSFIKSDDSTFVNLIKLVVITFSIWMIWRMRNYVRFQIKIDLFRAIFTIKDFTCLVGNSS